jgi:glycosyltransferase involved in cell wall biosynthesis
MLAVSKKNRSLVKGGIMYKNISNKSDFIMIFDIFLDSEGSKTHITEVSRQLEKLVNLTLVFPSCDKKEKIIKNVKYLPNIKKNYLFGFSYQISLFLYLMQCCIFNKPALLYTRQNFFTLSPAIIAKIFNIPYVVEVNGIITDELKVTNCSKTELVLAQLSEILNYRSCQKIVAVTEGIKKGIIELYNTDSEKIVVINNGVNIELFKQIDKSSARDEVNLDQKYRYICFVGKLAPWQGVEFLIRASPLILKECENARFLVVGDGIMRKEWIQLVEDLGMADKFIFTGSVPYEIVPTYINASDVCVVPKKPLKSGYSPLKLYEYMACGKPIIATRTKGFELLEETNSGILINSENPVEFANSTLILLDNPELMINMGNNGRKYVVTNHSWASVARNVLDVCNDLIEIQNLRQSKNEDALEKRRRGLD